MPAAQYTGGPQNLGRLANWSAVGRHHDTTQIEDVTARTAPSSQLTNGRAPCSARSAPCATAGVDCLATRITPRCKARGRCAES